MTRKSKHLSVIEEEAIPLSLSSQQDLFQIDDPHSNYSQAIDLYDLLPRVHPSSSNIRYLIPNIDLDPTEADWSVTTPHTADSGKIKKIRTTITPALIDTPKSAHKNLLTRIAKARNVLIEQVTIDDLPKRVYVYPGGREEKVENSLRKLSTAGLGEFDDDSTGVRFSLSGLRKELESVGVKLTLVNIKECLEVLSGSNLKVEELDQDDNVIIKIDASSFVKDIVWRNRVQWIDARRNGQDSLLRCSFHFLVNKAVSVGAFRLTNYVVLQSINNIIATFLFKHMSAKYTYAEYDGKPYTIKLTTIFSWMGRPVAARMADNTDAMKTAINILIEKNVIDKCEATPLKDPERANRIHDVLYDFYATQKFSRDMIESNKTRKITDQVVANINPHMLEGTALVEMTSTWQPREETKQEIKTAFSINKEQLSKLIAGFQLANKQATKESIQWERELSRYCKYHSEKISVQSENASFIGKHTDKTWREGL